jgi:hypothetical protein
MDYCRPSRRDRLFIHGIRAYVLGSWRQDYRVGSPFAQPATQLSGKRALWLFASGVYRPTGDSKVYHLAAVEVFIPDWSHKTGGTPGRPQVGVLRTSICFGAEYKGGHLLIFRLWGEPST